MRTASRRSTRRRRLAWTRTTSHDAHRATRLRAQKRKVRRTADGEASDCGFAHTIFAALWKQLKRATRRGGSAACCDGCVAAVVYGEVRGSKRCRVDGSTDIRQRAIETVRTLLLSGGVAVSMRAACAAEASSMRDLPMIVGDSDADDAERSGEVARKNILRAMDESGLDDNLIGSQLAGIVKDIHAPAKVRLDAIALAIDLKSAMPKRVQRHKIQSEQRVLRVSYENGRCRALAAHNWTQRS